MPGAVRLVLIAIGIALALAVPPSEYSALQSLYDSTNGEHWVWANYPQQWNFTGVHDPCLERWEGVYCAEPCRDGNSPDCAVVGLDLRLHNMSGTLPTSLQDFHNITLLDLSYNFIKGVIPAEIGELTTLVILDLSYLCLSGAIPSEIAGLGALEGLYLTSNYLFGSIPDLSGLSSLIDLDISANGGRNFTRAYSNETRSLDIIDTLAHGTGVFEYPPSLLSIFVNGTCGDVSSEGGLSGSISTSILELRRLERCLLGDNSLTGDIPMFSSDSTLNLEMIDLAVNFLTSTLPPSLATLRNLTVLDLSQNRVWGTIPNDYYTGMKRLEILDLGFNDLSGLLSPAVASTQTLKELVLVSNNFTGPLPPELGELRSLEVLSLGLGYNCFTGPLIPELGKLVNLRELEIADTALTGEIPVAIGSLSNLEYLNLADNNNRIVELHKCYNIENQIQYGLTGTLPPSIWRMTKLEKLVLRGNRLSGDIPSLNVEKMVNLKILDLERNELGEGSELPFPLAVTKLSNLEELYLDDNKFSGPFPPEIGNMTGLRLFSMETNDMFGSLPSQFAQLSKLSSLRLSRNNLGKKEDGGSNILPIPDVLYGLTNLEYLSLRGNGFTLRISSDIANLAKLEYVSLASNELTGPIPASIVWPRQLHSINFGDNKLSGSLPESLFDIPALHTLSLSHNALTGTLSTSLSKFSALEDFSISSNQMFGPLPEAWNCPNLEGLVISHNFFTGSLPSSLGDLTGLNFIEIHDNCFFGSLPNSLEKIPRLYNFDCAENSFTGKLTNFPMGYLSFLSVANNYFTGHLPPELLEHRRGGVSQFKLFSLSNNFFSGPAPQLTIFPKLEGYVIKNNLFTGQIAEKGLALSAGAPLFYIDISQNFVSGAVADIFRPFLNLEIVTISDNELTGTIPNDAILSQLQAFRAYNNYISGTLPSWLGDIPRMDLLLLQSNHLEGSNLQHFFKEDSHLEHLDLSDNFFNGLLPKSVWSIRSLRTVALSNNCFSGEFPAEMCNTENRLSVLVMDGLSSYQSCRDNDVDYSITKYFPDLHLFTEKLPQCLFQIDSLKELYLSGNGLTGELPSLPNSSALEILNLKNNYLAGRIPGSYFKHYFHSIDLSGNKLTGGLKQPITEYDNIDYSLNRISGEIPSRYRNMKSISILNGNLFGCENPSDLPKSDAESEEYSCGSKLLDISIMAWVALLVLAVTIILLVRWVIKYHQADDRSEGAVGSTAKVMQSVTSSRGWALFEDITRWYKISIALTSRKPGEMPELADFQIHPSQVMELSRFVASLLLIRSVGVVVAVAIFVVCMPLYLTVHYVGYSTHENAYGWVVTSGFVGGLAPAIIFAFVWVWICLFFVQTVLIGNGYVFGRTLAKKRQSSAAANTLSISSAAAVAAAKEHVPDPYKKSKLIAKSVAAITINTAVVLSVTALYVIAQVSHHVSASAKLSLQWAFAFWKLSWNTVGVPTCFRAMEKISQSRKVMVYLVTLYFNNVVGVILASLPASDNCFNKVLDDEQIESVYYEVIVCTGYNILRLCDERQAVQYSSIFYVPYIYGFQCTTSILRAFLPIFFYIYSAVAIIIPIMFLVVAFIPKIRISRPFRMVIPAILWPQSPLEEGEKLIVPNTVMINQLSHLFVLLTFGVMCPPLAVVIAISVFMLCSVWLILIGRYIEYNFCRKDIPGPEERSEMRTRRHLLERVFYHSWSSPMDSIGVTITVAALFYAVMVFDVMGDTEGAKRAVLLSMSLFSCLFLFQILRSGRIHSDLLQNIGLSVFINVPYRKWLINVLHDVSGLDPESETHSDRESRDTAGNISMVIMSAGDVASASLIQAEDDEAAVVNSSSSDAEHVVENDDVTVFNPLDTA